MPRPGIALSRWKSRGIHWDSQSLRLLGFRRLRFVELRDWLSVKLTCYFDRVVVILSLLMQVKGFVGLSASPLALADRGNSTEAYDKTTTRGVTVLYNKLVHS